MSNQNNNPDYFERIKEVFGGKLTPSVKTILADAKKVFRSLLLPIPETGSGVVANQEGVSGVTAGNDVNIGSISQQQTIIYIINKLDGKNLIQNHESVGKEVVNFICKAYCATIADFPKDWPSHRPRANNTDEILNQLLETSIRDKEILQKFVNNLRNQISTSQNNKQYQLQLNSYLLIQLRPDFNRDGNEELLLRAWFSPDDTIQVSGERFKALTVDEQQTQITFAPEKLPSLLGKLIQQCFKEYPQETPTRLTVEVFLPRVRLWDEVERWEYIDEENIRTPIGIRHRVVVRFYDRLKKVHKKEHKEQEHKWKENWLKVRHLWTHTLCEKEFMSLSEKNDFNLTQLRNCLLSKIALKVSCKLSESDMDGLLRAIYSAGIPIVILSRNDVLDPNNRTEFDKLLKDGPLNELSERFKEMRLAANQDGDEMHLSKDLVLLWDDPNRIPPDYSSEPNTLSAG